MIELHPTAKVSHLADIEDSVRGTRIVVGAHSVIDSFVKVKPAGGSGDLVVGEHVVINAGCVLYTGNGIHIGNYVAIAANCTFAPVNHAYADRSRLIREQGFLPSKGGIVIEDDVWIGANCVLLDGAVLRRGCVVGAGSIVRGELLAYTVYAGPTAGGRGGAPVTGLPLSTFTVLGATGYIGSRLVAHLQAQGHTVWAPARGDAEVFTRPLGHVMYCVGLTADFRTRPFDTVDAHVGLLAEVLRRAQFESLLYLSSTRVYMGAASHARRRAPGRAAGRPVVPVQPHQAHRRVAVPCQRPRRGACGTPVQRGGAGHGCSIGQPGGRSAAPGPPGPYGAAL